MNEYTKIKIEIFPNKCGHQKDRCTECNRIKRHKGDHMELMTSLSKKGYNFILDRWKQ